MKLNRSSQALLAIAAVAAPFALVAPGAALAKKPGIQADCVVGSGTYPTIQSAIDDADCGTIAVPAGTFLESVTIGRNLTLRGAGPHHSTIDGSANLASTVRVVGAWAGPCVPAVAVTIEGMTITGGTGPAPCDPPLPCQRNGGGIGASPGADLTVKNCIVTGNSAAWSGGGISVPGGRLTVVDSVITRNTAFADPAAPSQYDGGGGIRIAGCPAALVVRDSVIRFNVSYGLGGGILAFGVPSPQPAGTVVVENSDIRHNTATAANGGGGIFYDYATLTVTDSKIRHNTPDDVRAGPNP